jgi:Raf kinase inhibitor-like YbhB/YbcL family protein
MRGILASAVLVLAGAQTGAAAAMELHSPDIAPNATIANEQIYTRCGGQNISPALSWSGAPAGTKSFALTTIDLDVKPSGWAHWIVLGIPPGVTSLAKGVSKLPQGATAVTSDLGQAGYGGPCPPVGSGLHHYQFTIWAMPANKLSFARKTPPFAISAALAKQALAHATFTGTVER